MKPQKAYTFRRIFFLLGSLVLLFPVLITVFFHFSVLAYSVRKAERSIDQLDSQIREDIQRAREKTVSGGSLDHEFDETILRIVDNITVSDLQAAQIILFTPELDCLYPKGVGAATPLAQLISYCSEEIRSGQIPDGFKNLAVRGERYVFHTIDVPYHGHGSIRFIIFYVTLGNEVRWNNHLTISVLVASAIFALLGYLLLERTVKRAADMSESLVTEIRRIGGGDYTGIEGNYSIREMDDIRTAVNRLSDILQHSKEQRVSFLQNISHDMRAHLMSVTSYAQALEAGIAEPPEAGRQIIKEGEALKDIIDNDLTFSKLEDPLLPVTLSPVPVLDLVQNSIDRFTAMGMQKGILLRLENSESEPVAAGHEALVEKILDNLLSNAIRYANHEIVISAESRAGKVILSVADDGIGLSETDMAHVFDRYYKGRGGQHGIGLTIAHTAAERMGGSLTAENRPQGGALFTLTLPAAGSTNQRTSI